MGKNLVKFVAISLVFVVALFGCGGGSGDDSNNQDSVKQDSVLVLGESYDEKAGDIFTTSSTMDISYSNGQTAKINSVSVKTYSQVDQIPSEYNYSNAIEGPYLLETTTEDDEIDELEYMTLSGQSIIDDDLDYFTNIEYTTENGSEEPENIHIGDKYTFYQESTLFDSQVGSESGYEIMNMEFSVLSEEKVTIPAGEYNAVKIGYNISGTTSKNDVIDTLSATGYGWFDTTNGYMLKMTVDDGEMTLGEFNLTASFSSKIVLQSYFISKNEVSSQMVGVQTRKASTLPNSDIKIGSIILGLKKGVRLELNLARY